MQQIKSSNHARRLGSALAAAAAVAVVGSLLMGAARSYPHPYRVAHHPVRHVVRKKPAKAWLPPPPPWPRPADTQDRIFEAGLHPGRMEGMALHIHQHLDVFYNGKHVTVPAGIGLGPGFYSEVHTHSTWGTIHVESPVVHDFTLGQFFEEWGVSLRGAKVYDEGRFVRDPRNLILRDQQEIAVIYGRPPRVIPKVYPGYHL